MLFLLSRLKYTVRLETGVFVLALCLATASAYAANVRVAVATNFAAPTEQLTSLFEEESGHTVTLSFASTGQIYAQIVQGAPFDVFMAADQARPNMAERDGYAVPGGGFTYAVGRLALYSRDSYFVRDEKTLRQGNFDRLAIANPNIAPYGLAAKKTLVALGMYELLKPKLVQGNSIAQAYQFVASGNVELGFVSLSQIINHRHGSRWLVPQEFHPPLAQKVTLLAPGKDNAAAVEFLAFLKSSPARSIIEKYGYETIETP